MYSFLFWSGWCVCVCGIALARGSVLPQHVAMTSVPTSSCTLPCMMGLLVWLVIGPRMQMPRRRDQTQILPALAHPCVLPWSCGFFHVPSLLFLLLCCFILILCRVILGRSSWRRPKAGDIHPTDQLKYGGSIKQFPSYHYLWWINLWD